jgi:hypothetical protein
VRAIIFPCLSRREITGRLHRPSIIYIEEYPGFLPLSSILRAPTYSSTNTEAFLRPVGVRVVLPGMKIMVASSRGYISHRCPQIVQDVLQQVSHSQINIQNTISSQTATSQKKGKLPDDRVCTGQPLQRSNKQLAYPQIY